MCLTRRTSTSLLQIIFSCIYQYSDDPENGKETWKARFKDPHHRNIRNLQKCSLDSDPAHLEALVVCKVADPTLCATRKRIGRLVKDNVEEEVIIIVPEQMLKRLRKEQILLPRSTSKRKANTTKYRKQEKDNEEDLPKCQKNIDNIETSLSLSRI